MTPARRNILWPLIIVLVGSIWLLMVAGALPEAVGDILLRSWPALLILFGFDVLVGRRRLRIGRWPMPMSLTGLVVIVALLAGVVWLAYAKQANTVRADQVEAWSETLPETVTQVRLQVAVKHTVIVVQASVSADDPRLLRAEFQGSRESIVEMIPTIEGDTLRLAVAESQRNTIPKLDNYGLSTLTILLPADVTVELLEASNEQGDMRLDLSALSVRRVELAANKGAVTLSLPARDTLTGKIHIAGGGIELIVPSNMALTANILGGIPDYRYNRDRYLKIEGGPLETRDTGGAFQVSLDITLQSGVPFMITDLE